MVNFIKNTAGVIIIPVYITFVPSEVTNGMISFVITSRALYIWV